MIHPQLITPKSLVAIGTGLGLLAGGLTLLGYDIRVNGSPTVLSVTFPGGSTQTQLNLGGRVGNWRPEDDTIIFDVPVGVGATFHKTDIYTLPSIGGNATWISNNNTMTGWTSVDPPGQPPPTGATAAVYVGNAWTCPGNEYTLFQASEPNSLAGGGAGPGAGVDNNVWAIPVSGRIGVDPEVLAGKLARTDERGYSRLLI